MNPITRALACFALCACSYAQADEPSLDLGKYRHSATYALPASLGEVSAVTWNWDDNSLYVLDDEGRGLSRVSLQGALISSMKLSGFDDTEGLAYIGNGQFVLTEERLQSAYLFKYAAGDTRVRAALPVVTLGPKVGNVGLEGISYDRGTGHFIVVKEKEPLTVIRAELHFDTGKAQTSALFTRALDVLDLADVQVLAGGELLLLSQESARLLQVDATGAVLSRFELRSIASTAEGVTIDAAGTLYVVDEKPSLHVLSPTPPQ